MTIVDVALCSIVCHWGMISIGLLVLPQPSPGPANMYRTELWQWVAMAECGWLAGCWAMLINFTKTESDKGFDND